MTGGGRLARRVVVGCGSGDNWDFSCLPEGGERAQRNAGVKKCFSLRQEKRAGALSEFLNLLGQDDDIGRFVTEHVRTLGGVRDTFTLIAYKAFA